MENDKQRNDWHSAFRQAIKVELLEYEKFLEFLEEYSLTTEPLRIDCIIVKKPKDLVIEKNFARFFKEINIIEYKSPGDFLSIKDFYKVYAYTSLYSFLEKGAITEKTITFVVSRTPKKLFKYLRGIRKYSVEKTSIGIYNVIGDYYPIQVINTSKVSENENLLLKCLTSNLKSPLLNSLLTESKRHKEWRGLLAAYFNVIVTANEERFKEAYKMATKTLEDILREVGALENIEARGKQEIAKNMINMGFSIDVISKATEMEPEKIKSLMAQSIN